MKILITGCAGFIGTNFLKYYINKYSENTIIGCDLLTYAANKNFLEEIPNDVDFKFVKGDISNFYFIDELFDYEKPDIVINFAAESHVDNSILFPNIFANTNIIGTINILNACKKFKIQRFHQVSTDEVYGSLPLESTDSFNEENKIEPRNPYSATKASADLLTIAYYYTYGLPVTISRCTNNYGPFQHREKFIPKIIYSLLHNDPIPIYGDGTNMRDWLYVQDHCAAIDLIINNGICGELYNIGANNKISNIDLVNLIISKLGASTNLINFVKDRPGHDKKYSVDIKKITKLGWQPNISFEKGIEITLNWYKNLYGVKINN